ncbi:putative alpha/beta hydrolase [Mycobacterium stomatepiae]|uniref:Predicted hydrolase N-terminal domain-containing protein n=1 Tax=Mycobacterium stomatepiae TaxID=470076 RepID=A0A7I7QCN4_9MYCO|nr:hypothetical protein [Mycobacterium stomatepiae]MCV7165045.1 hypothetical protein [Mycobacterium stomatepiae]BBY24078.1 hypothetical protein MSTO_42830 [Mycobacterium stomatepiae]
MQLRYISIPALIAEAGGDPWAINQSLQAGRPAQISDLAEAFHAAGVCTAESSKASDEARRRFEAAWNREGGEHPINDSAEVQRVTTLLGAQSLQIPKIGVDLESIAAALAEAQKAGAGRIAALENQLQTLDNMIGQAIEMEKDPHLSAADRQALDTFITGREDDAIRDTQAAVNQMHSIRDTYANSLHQVQANGNLTAQDAVLATDFKPADLGEGDGLPTNDPRIVGPAADPQHEQNTYDLQDQFQDGQGPIFGGDPRDGLPRSPASQLAQGPPGTRPLPTGTALGPNGRRYAFFSNPDGSHTPGLNEYATNGSVWDYTDPAHPVKVGELPGIFQASGVYDPATNQMVIIGNTSNRTGDLNRGLWVSGPIDPANPNGWMNSLHRIGDVSLPGDRESQLIALKGGGYMFVGATNGGLIQAISAATPQGLTAAAPQTLIDAGKLPTVYGPTVTGTTIDPATGLETVQLRVSTWPPGPIYDPNTWTTTFGVQH